MSQQDLDELFGESGDSPEPRLLQAYAMALSGVALAIVGMACLAAPGGVLVLLALGWIEREHERVDTGYLAPEARPSVQRARRAVLACLGLLIVLFFAQAFLYCSGFYQTLGDELFGLL